MVSPTQVTEARGCPLGISAQQAELVALTWVVQLAQGKRINIYLLIPNSLFWSYIHMQPSR